jgi:hypothetical protein
MPDETRRILAAFTRFVQEFVGEEKICGCRVRNTTDGDHPKVEFFNDVYMLSVSPTDAEFFDLFLETQAFAAYFEQAAI